MSQPPATLQASGLAIGYGARQLASGLQFSLQGGEILALLGPNGSGKSTLLRTLLGLHAPQAGQLLLDGQALAHMPRAALARRIGYVPQAYASHFGYSVHDTVLMGRAAHLPLLAQPGAADRRIATACLQRLGIAHLAGHSMQAISGGERQLALMARALAQQAALLILDEPTASLDFGNQLRVLEHLQQLRQQGMGILLCTHQPEHAMAVADRIMLLHQGGLIGPGPPREVATAERLAALYRVSPQQLRAHLRFRFEGG
ncbi:MAG: ABC transporter ATP-binding protein [Comamonadaceae bacterium]|nr:ABC transporter ATP-binding protein [Comamonadaceae bacterium]